MVATREAYGVALAKLGDADPRVVALDADVKNSTFSDKFEAKHPDRFYQFFIAEQVMVGAAMGLAARGAIPFPSTFAAFLTRAADFIRMAAIGGNNIKMAGSHAGVSIGEDGPSQMALEDFAMFTAQPNFVALYPCDAVSTERLIAEAAAIQGPVYIRTSRPKTPVIYDNDEQFPIGGLKVVRKSDKDTATVIGAGITLFEAIKAHDELKAKGISIRVIDLYSVQPIDAASLIEAGEETGRLITVEDHYIAGGLGDAVARAVAPAGLTVTRLAVPEIPRSGKPEELVDKFGISARHIVDAVTVVDVRTSDGLQPSPLAMRITVLLARLSLRCKSRVARKSPVGVQEPAWAPDGKRIAVSYLDRIWTMTPDGRQAKAADAPTRARSSASRRGRPTARASPSPPIAATASTSSSSREERRRAGHAGGR